MKKFMKLFVNSMLFENPSIVLLLGLCPLLAASTTLKNGIGLGAAAIIVLTFSGAVISLIGRFIPKRIKTVSYMVIVACFVGIIELLLRAYTPNLAENIGIYLPLFTVSGIAFVQAELSEREPFGGAILNGLLTGMGFCGAMLVMSFVRELFGLGTVLELRVFPEEYAVLLVQSQAGALFIFVMLAAIVKKLSPVTEKKEVER